LEDQHAGRVRKTWSQGAPIIQVLLETIVMTGEVILEGGLAAESTTTGSADEEDVGGVTSIEDAAKHCILMVAWKSIPRREIRESISRIVCAYWQSFKVQVVIYLRWCTLRRKRKSWNRAGRFTG
jgi:hypothetical protein